MGARELWKRFVLGGAIAKGEIDAAAIASLETVDELEGYLLQRKFDGTLTGETIFALEERRRQLLNPRRVLPVGAA